MKTHLTALLLFVFLALNVQGQSKDHNITYDVSTGKWDPALSSLNLKCGDNLIVRVKGYNYHKYDIAMSYNGREFTSEMPAMFRNAFDPSALAGMLNTASSTLNYNLLENTKTESDDSKALTENTEIKKSNDAAAKSFEAQLNTIVKEIEVLEKSILEDLVKLSQSDSDLHSQLSQTISSESPPSGTIAATNSDNDYKRLMDSLKKLNQKILELSALEAKTARNTKKLEEATTHLTGFIAQLKDPLVKEVSNYYQLKSQADYFTTLADDLKNGMEMQIMYVCSNQLDIDIELIPKDPVLIYEPPSPFLATPLRNTDKKTVPEKNTADTKTDSAGKKEDCGCCNSPVVINNACAKTDPCKKEEKKEKPDSTAAAPKKESSLIHKYHLPKQTISIPVRRSFLSFSAGAYVSGLSNEGYTWRNEYTKDTTIKKDSIRLVKERKSAIPDFGILTQAHFTMKSTTGKNAALGINIGAGINLPDFRLRYVVGASGIFGRQNQFVLSAGAMFGQVDKLSTAYSENMGLSPDAKPDNLYVRVWDASWYVSVSYGIRTYKKTGNHPEEKKTSTATD